MLEIQLKESNLQFNEDGSHLQVVIILLYQQFYIALFQGCLLRSVQKGCSWRIGDQPVRAIKFTCLVNLVLFTRCWQVRLHSERPNNTHVLRIHRQLILDWYYATNLAILQVTELFSSMTDIAIHVQCTCWCIYLLHCRLVNLRFGVAITSTVCWQTVY